MGREWGKGKFKTRENAHKLSGYQLKKSVFSSKLFTHIVKVKDYGGPLKYFTRKQNSMSPVPIFKECKTELIIGH